MSDDIYAGLTQLGGDAKLPASPEEAVLERVPNPQAGERYIVRFTAPEFTSLCPITGQPDFAHLVIDYVPHGGHRQAPARVAGAAVDPYRRLLVSARWHADRRVLAVGRTAGRRLDSGPGSTTLSRAWIA
jgi:hypothetical protein